MPKLIAECHYDIGGGRKVYQDRVSTRRLTTGAGLNLVVALVTDGGANNTGERGENASDRAAAAAHDGFISYLEKSRETVIPSLLTNAVQYANDTVFKMGEETGGATTTLVAVVVEENSAKLFVANVGNSRAYLCRNHKLTQLTIDHSFANVMPWRGQISAEAARTHPRANVLVRTLGAREKVEVDLGFYVGTSDYEEANTYGMEGLPLQEGDGVLVCSDGLIKDSPKTHEPLIKPDEIIRTLGEKEGKKAVQELVSFALGRGPNDNISAAVIQMPDRMRAWRARRPAIIAGASILFLLIGLIGVIYALGNTRGVVQELAQQQTGTAKIVAEIEKYTKTPSQTATLTFTPSITPTLTHTLKPPEANQAAVLEPDGDVLHVGDSYQAGPDGAQMRIYHSTKISNGFLYAMPGSQLTFDYVDTDRDDNAQFIFRMEPGSQGFLSSGGYNQAKLILPSVNVTFYFQGCFAINYSAAPPVLTGSCYAGVCTYTLGSSERNPIAEGTRLEFDAAGALVGEAQPILEADARQWQSRLPDGPASDCARRYIPTPTITPSRTNTLFATQQKTGVTPGKPGAPTHTPTPTPTSTPLPTSTPVPTATPLPTPTPTPLPTNTPLPTATPLPTDTPVPTATPTNTPVPTSTPTNTPVPTATPTNTPVPPPTDTPAPTPTNTPVPP